jgi:hypothetical protein
MKLKNVHLRSQNVKNKYTKKRYKFKRRRSWGLGSNVNYKLPILTKVELVNSSNFCLPSTSTPSSSVLASSVDTAQQASTTPSGDHSSTLVASQLQANNNAASINLFSDYLLISSKTKYKYLLYSLFEQLKLENKQNYLIVDGMLRFILL